MVCQAQIWLVNCFNLFANFCCHYFANYCRPTAVKTVSSLIDRDGSVTKGKGIVEFDGLPNFHGLPAVMMQGNLSVDFESKYELTSHYTTQYSMVEMRIKRETESIKIGVFCNLYTLI